MQVTLLNRDLETLLDTARENHVDIIDAEIKFHDFIVSDPIYTVDTSDKRREIMQKDVGDIQFSTINNLSYDRNKSTIFKPFYTAVYYSIDNRRVSRFGIIEKAYITPGFLDMLEDALDRLDGFTDFILLTQYINTFLKPDYYLECHKVESIEGIGVDSARAGFFDYMMFEDPDLRKRIEPALDKDNYYDEYPNIVITDEFCVSSSGFGDGCYDLYEIHLKRKVEDKSQQILEDQKSIVIGYFIDYALAETKELLDQAENMTETFEIYFGDLKEEVQDELIKFLGDNGNFDVYPISKIIKNTKTGDKFIANFNTIKEEE